MPFLKLNYEKKGYRFCALVFVVALGFLLLVNKTGGYDKLSQDEFSKKNEEKEAAYHYLRWKYEADMVKDPTTGEALFGLRDQEIEFARTIPQRNTSSPVARLHNSKQLFAGWTK